MKKKKPGKGREIKEQKQKEKRGKEQRAQAAIPVIQYFNAIFQQ